LSFINDTNDWFTSFLLEMSKNVGQDSVSGILHILKANVQKFSLNVPTKLTLSNAFSNCWGGYVSTNIYGSLIDKRYKSRPTLIENFFESTVVIKCDCFCCCFGLVLAKNWTVGVECWVCETVHCELQHSNSTYIIQRAGNDGYYSWGRFCGMSRRRVT
jgi:hypothetical protein